MKHPSVPSGLPGSAPLMPQGQTAQRSLGCVGCTPVMNPAVAAPVAGLSLAGPGIGDMQTWFDRIPLWIKIGVGVLTFAGVSYGVYRLVR